MDPDVQRLLQSGLSRCGFYVLEPSDGGPVDVVSLARAIGSVYVAEGEDPCSPVVQTNPREGSSRLQPFDQAEAIGWHNDFSSHHHRPEVTVSCLTRADPLGPAHGAWRVASGEEVVSAMRDSLEERSTIEYLLATDLPFSFTGEGQPAFHRVLEARGPAPGRLGLRFYGRALRDGARLAYGAVPREIERAVSAVERAADRVGHTVAATVGSVLVAHNWYALHDRLAQTVSGDEPLRRSVLCFVDTVDWGNR